MSFLFLDRIYLCLFVLIMGSLSICLHEWAHGILATKGGDSTIEEKGYLSLNPVNYSERLVSLALPLLLWSIGGFPLPGALLYLNGHLLRNRWWRSAAAAAGPAMTGVLAIAFSLPFILHLPINPQGWLGSSLAVLADWMFTVLLVSLLPIPGLDGYAILEPWLPKALQKRSRFLKQFGFACSISPVLMLARHHGWAEHRFTLASPLSASLGIPEEAVRLGFEQFSPVRGVMLLLVIGLAFGYSQRSKAAEQGVVDQGKLDREAQLLKLQHKANQAKLEQEPHHYGALVDQGNVLMKQRAYARAVEHYSEALKHYPEDANFWQERGFAKARQQKFAEALPDYEQSLKYRPKDYDTLHIKADALLMLKRNEEAVDTFTKVLRHYPNDDHIWYDKGWVLQQLGRDEEALQAYQKALKINGDDEKHWTMVAHTHDKLGQQAECDRILTKGLKRHPKSFHLWDFTLDLALNQKDYVGLLELCDRCEPHLKKGVTVPFYALEPSIHLWIEQARCHVALHNIAQAKEALTSAKVLDAPTTERLITEKPTLAELWQEHFVSPADWMCCSTSDCLGSSKC